MRRQLWVERGPSLHLPWSFFFPRLSDVLLLMLALAPVNQNPLAVTHPKGDRQPLFSESDYPAEARQTGWEGSVIFDLTVTPEGRVSKCVIVESSGHAVLDTATCTILTTRAKFYPAKDRNGKPVEDVVRTPPINWSL